jgi:hypothetical protein
LFYLFSSPLLTCPGIALAQVLAPALVPSSNTTSVDSSSLAAIPIDGGLLARAIRSLFSSSWLSLSSDPTHRLFDYGMPLTLFAFFLLSIVSFVVALFTVRERPPTPPSASALAQEQSVLPFLESLKLCLFNGPYLVVVMTFGIGLGVFNVITTLLAQIIQPLGFDAVIAGMVKSFPHGCLFVCVSVFVFLFPCLFRTFCFCFSFCLVVVFILINPLSVRRSHFLGILGAALLGIGLVASGVVAPIIDYTHRFKELYCLGFFVAMLGMIATSLSIYFTRNVALIGACFCLLGIGAFIILPVALELSLETCYPVPAVTSAGFLWMIGQISSVVLIFACDAMRDPKTGSFQLALWVIDGMCVVGFVGSLLLIYPLKTEYKRLREEFEAKALVNAGEGVINTDRDEERERDFLIRKSK